MRRFVPTRVEGNAVQKASLKKMDSRQAIQRDVEDLRQLNDRISTLTHRLDSSLDLLAGLGALGEDFRAQERRLDQAAWSLRKSWLEFAHRPADATMKSPCAGHGAHVASGSDVDFGYERDLDLSVLEARRKGYMDAADGWSSDLVVFRSGQAALAALLQLSVHRWGTRSGIAVRHEGAYFETKSLLALYPERIFTTARDDYDIAILEPVWCDGQFGCAATGLSPRHALFLDTTMVGAAYDIRPHLITAPQIVVAYSSGLKLDQAGLELANVGIARIYTKGVNADDVGNALRRYRALSGTTLTLDELSALSAPWFMDRIYTDNYSDAVFANNQALAFAIGNNSRVFRSLCHPSLKQPLLPAPFCALQLNEPSSARYAALVDRLEREIEWRGLLAARGGSFGFRGHRYELIDPIPDDCQTFVRIALGWRDGHSRKGLCDLLQELSVDGF